MFHLLWGWEEYLWMCSGSNALCNRKDAYWEHFCLLGFFFFVTNTCQFWFTVWKWLKATTKKLAPALIFILTLVAMGWLMVKNMIIAAEPVDFSFYIKTKKNIQFLNMFCQNMGWFYLFIFQVSKKKNSLKIHKKFKVVFCCLCAQNWATWWGFIS